MTTEELYQIYLKHPSICTDTRRITKDCLFFCLRGDNFNGNTFAGQALEAGASYVIIDDEDFAQPSNCILVDDVLGALQNLARYHRTQLSIPFIGLTGTNGKTTTKELIRSVLSQKFNTYATTGNLNNHIGVPLTILGIGNDTEIAIIEMGANHQKEIEFLASIAQPTHGLITNVGKGHLEGFGGFEGVKKGKGELYDNLKKSNSIVFINIENEHLLEMSRSRNLSNVIYYGNREGSQVQGTIIENNPFLTIKWARENDSYIVKTSITGAYNLENLLVTVTIGLHFGLDPEDINKGITGYQPGNNRSQVTRTASNTLICDYYNANPSSMNVALENFTEMEAENKVIILGDMFELGDEAAQEHLNVINKASQIPHTEKIFVGENFYPHKDDSKGRFFASTVEAGEYLENKSLKNSTILIKGSRGMKLEQLLEWL